MTWSFFAAAFFLPLLLRALPLRVLLPLRAVLFALRTAGELL